MKNQGDQILARTKEVITAVHRMRRNRFPEWLTCSSTALCMPFRMVYHWLLPLDLYCPTSLCIRRCVSIIVEARAIKPYLNRCRKSWRISSDPPFDIDCRRSLPSALHAHMQCIPSSWRIDSPRSSLRATASTTMAYCLARARLPWAIWSQCCIETCIPLHPVTFSVEFDNIHSSEHS